MNRPIVYVLAAVAALGSWLFFKNTSPRRTSVGVTGSSDTTSVSTVAQSATASTEITLARQRVGRTVRVATFHLRELSREKVTDPRMLEKLSGLALPFDVLAIQGIRSDSPDVLPRWVEHLNRQGRRFDYLISPYVGRADQREQFAFLFDAESVDVDRYQYYSVNDPNDLLALEPFVGWFRARGVPEEEAFTFSLVSIKTDPHNWQRELSLYANLFRNVRNDGRMEDDIIILGDFQADWRQLQDALSTTDLRPAVTDQTTDIERTRQWDNILFSLQATTEFAGKSGVVDYVRQYNLTLDEAAQVSLHLPVWAEFSAREGGPPGHVASPVTKQLR